MPRAVAVALGAGTALVGWTLVGCGADAANDGAALAVLVRARDAERDLSYRGIRYESIVYDGGELRCRVHVHHGPDRSEAPFAAIDLPRPGALRDRLTTASDPVSTWLRAAIGPELDGTAEPLAAALDRALLDRRPWNVALFSEIPGTRELREALAAGPTGSERIRLRRRLLAAAYPTLVRSGEPGTRESRSWLTEAGEATARFDADDGRVAWLDAPERLLRSYRLVADGTEGVAGRIADRYRLASDRPGRFSRRIWVDRETGFLLRDLSFDASGRLVEERRYEFVEFGVGAPEPGFGVARRRTAADGIEETSLERLASEAAFVVYVPRVLPDGFEPEPVTVRWSGDPAGPVHLVFSDGLARIELRERRAARRATGALARRRVDGGTTRLAFVWGGTKIDVIGRNVDAALLTRVVESLPSPKEGES